MLSGERVVMLRAVALRLESGAITSTSMPSSPHSARRAACRPGAEMPSSLVSRMRTALILGVGDGLQKEPVRGRGFPRLRPGCTVQQPGEALDGTAPGGDLEHGADQDPDHVAHEGVRRHPEVEDVPGL